MRSASGELLIMPFWAISKFGPKMFKLQPFTGRKAQPHPLMLQERPKHHQTYYRGQPKWYPACWPNFGPFWHSWRPRKRPILPPKCPHSPCEGPQMSQRDQNWPQSPEKQWVPLILCNFTQYWAVLGILRVKTGPILLQNLLFWPLGVPKWPKIW